MRLVEEGALSLSRTKRDKFFRFYNQETITVADGSVLVVQPWSEAYYGSGQEVFHLNLYQNGEVLDPTLDPRFAPLFTTPTCWLSYSFNCKDDVRSFIEKLQGPPG